ncbi:hypothetical protein [uncultured Dysosmobacter sp.]|uniref:hypothetical protein n=1 Tax=uncultured Dysosmobacter sp. TaxID=2591384 RepID=UPI0026319A80|nr:hypothetical protein [uncultured Dysosmobacter sp.]
MEGFDEKLNSLLSNPDAMAQIMQMAQSLSGGQEAPPGPSPAPPPPAPSGSPFQGFGGDPKLLAKLLPLVQELGGDSNARQLLYALRPYLKEERQAKVERALQLARLFHLGKKFLADWEG